MRSDLLEAIDEIEHYCNENSWISDIKKFITKYSLKLVLEWKAIGSLEIEEQLNRIRLWIDQIKMGIEKTILTRNRLLKVDCSSLEETLVPKLEAIFTEICECILLELNKDTSDFNGFMTKIIKVKFFSYTENFP